MTNIRENSGLASVFAARLFMILLYLLAVAAYLGHGWSHELASWQGDEFIYLLTADYFSPWTENSAVSAYKASNSQFPPFFPLLLGLGGGASHIFAANITTVVCFLLGFLIFFFWLLAEKLTEWNAYFLALIFAILPGTYMQALFVCSEGLYLMFSLACLFAVATGDKSRNEVWFMAAAIFASAASLTRSAGLALVIALALYLIWRRPARMWLILAITILPSVAWSLYMLAAGGTEHQSYISAFLETYSTRPMHALIDQVLIEAPYLWRGLVMNFTTSSIGVPVYTFMGVLFMGGMAYRLYLRKLDGLYVLLYLGMILLWPFPHEAKRFILVIVPILLFQAFFLIRRLSQNLHHLRAIYIEILYLSIIFILALPTLALAIGRYEQTIAPDMEPFRRAGWWYSWYANNSMETRPQDMMYARGLSEGLRTIGNHVPINECLYSVKAHPVSYYTGRISKFPPREELDDSDFRKALHELGCRYFLFMNDTSPSISRKSFYPAGRLENDIQLIAEISYMESGDKTVLGVLGKLK